MFTKRKISYKGIDASGEYRVLPPTFGGIKSLVERVGGDIELASQVYPERDIPDDESHDIVEDFVQNLQYCDKVERVGLVREFSDYVKSLSQEPNQEPKQEPKQELEQEPKYESSAD